MVDGYNFFKDFASPERLVDRKLSDIEGDDRTIVNLLTDQIEFANVILLNKIDLVSEDELKTVEGIIRGLNAKAKIIKTKHSKIALKEVLGSKLFNGSIMWA